MYSELQNKTTKHVLFKKTILNADKNKFLEFSTRGSSGPVDILCTRIVCSCCELHDIIMYLDHCDNPDKSCAHEYVLRCVVLCSRASTAAM